jgi:hypothetical protein
MAHDASRNHHPGTAEDNTTAHQRADGADRIQCATDFILASLSSDSPAFGPSRYSRQETALHQWAESVGLLLDTETTFPKFLKGGMEHDVLPVGERMFKVTKGGVFGFSPGLELHLESNGGTRKAFHLWEATPLEYLERLALHNLLVPGINTLEGIILQQDADLCVVTSQPLFEISASTIVTVPEIDAWFAQQGFTKITHAAYYRAADNLAVFDAHEKNVVRSGPDFVPFDIIPCFPAAGFQAYIRDVLAAGETLRAVRSTRTTRME